MNAPTAGIRVPKESRATASSLFGTVRDFAGIMGRLQEVWIAMAPAIRLVGHQRTFAGWHQKLVAPATTTSPSVKATRTWELEDRGFS